MSLSSGESRYKKYEEDITSSDELDNFFERVMEDKIFSEESLSGIESSIVQVESLRNLEEHYRNIAKQLVGDGSAVGDDDREELAHVIQELFTELENTIDRVDALNKFEKSKKQKIAQPKQAENIDYHRSKAIASINHCLIDRFFVAEICELYSPDKAISNSGLIPPMKVLEDENPEKVRKMISILERREGKIDEEKMKIVRKEISINNP